MPSVERFRTSLGLTRKAVLVIDYAPVHPNVGRVEKLRYKDSVPASKCHFVVPASGSNGVGDIERKVPPQTLFKTDQHNG